MSLIDTNLFSGIGAQCFSDVSKEGRDADQSNGGRGKEDEKGSSCHGEGGGSHACGERAGEQGKAIWW